MKKAFSTLLLLVLIVLLIANTSCIRNGTDLQSASRVSDQNSQDGTGSGMTSSDLRGSVEEASAMENSLPADSEQTSRSDILKSSQLSGTKSTGAGSSGNSSGSSGNASNISFPGSVVSSEKESVSQNFQKSVRYTPSTGILLYNFGEIQLPVNGIGIKNSGGSPVNQSDSSFSGTANRTVISRELTGGQVQTTVCTENDGTLSFVQNARCESGISSVSLTFTVPMDLDLIIPVWGGVRLTREHPDFFYGRNFHLSYPNDWQAQMFLVQGKDGGMLVYSEDNATQFKALTVTHDGNSFYITIETIPQAPYDTRTTFQSKPWKMIPYKSEWTEGAKIYRNLTSKLFRLPEAASQKAGWAARIQLVILDDLNDPGLLKAFADEVIPEQTLILVPGWRKEQYDVNYPDYTPKPGIREKIKATQSLGFKVGVHCNMIGADINTEEYKKYLTGAHSLNDFTKQPIIERYSAFGQNFAFGQINPASSAWRNLFVSKMKQIVADLGVNVIHLDQSLLCFNDGRGLVEGMTSMQGNILFMKELTKALPGIAFSGEGLTEIDMQYISFLQMHVYGVNSSTSSYSDAAIDQICPVSDAIFGEYTSLYHYPALPVVAKAMYYDAWYRAGERSGLLPTLMRESTDSILSPSRLMETVLNQALWRQQNSPKINIINPWPENLIFKYTLKNGTPFPLTSYSSFPN